MTATFPRARGAGTALGLLLVFSLLALETMAAGGGTLARDTILRQRPSAIAPEAASAGAGEALEVLARRGYWLRVRIVQSADEGWVRSIRVRHDGAHRPARAAKPASSSGFFSSLARGATSLLGGGKGRSTAGRATTTIGIRGLSAQELTAARADPKAVVVMDRLGARPGSARRFAAEAGLTARRVSYAE